MDYFDNYWSNILNLKQGDANALLENFVHNMNDVFDENVRLKKFSKYKFKLNTKPWTTAVLQKLIYSKNVLFNRYIK